MKTAITRKISNLESTITKLIVVSAFAFSPALALAKPAAPVAHIHTSSVHEHGVQLHSTHEPVVHRS